ncbi:MAG: peptide ABC transporter substrate-binding protein [candidate division Zixibacteria bacterium]|nr:peptide ABC transporter substrate-binding protein [candidate division Zixibacteria bacterium]
MLRPFALTGLFVLTGLLVFSSAPGDKRYVNSLGIPLPPDAAPPEEQVHTEFAEDKTYMERFRTNYKGSVGMHLIAEPLARTDHHFDLLPAAAERWEMAQDGLSWTFYLRPGMVFSDGAPLDARDYVYTFRHGADPKNAYDAEWYYRPIKNWGAVVAGRMPLDSLGVQVLDELTLRVESEDPAPYLPALLSFSWVSPRRAIEKYGDTWSTRPETSVSSGPFRLTEWTKGNRIVLSLNTAYRGVAQPYLEKIVYKLFTMAAQPPFLAAFEAGETEYTGLVTQAEVARVKQVANPQTFVNQYTDFMTYYLTFDTYNGVFTDQRIRQAFSHAIDRDALCRSALREFGIPAYAMMPSGFPAASEEKLAPIQRFDLVLARRYLAAAGYPDGKGFPVMEMWLRNESLVQRTAAEAIQAMLKRYLNIEIQVRNMEAKVFMDALNSHTLPLAMVPYQYDYVDASSLLNIWMSNGRHAWKNDVFDQLVREANGYAGPESERIRLYQEAERVLVEDVGGVFLWHPRINQIWKSSLGSSALEVNRYGQQAWRGDQLSNLSVTMYIKKRAVSDRNTGSSMWNRIGAWFRRE